MNCVVVNAGGNTTAFVYENVPKDRYSVLSCDIMRENPDIDQIAFVKEPTGSADVRIELMGGEFCCNAVRSIAYMIGEKSGADNAQVLVECSGADSAVPCGYDRSTSSAYALIEPATDICEYEGFPLVKLQGISHIIAKGEPNEGVFSKLGEYCRELCGEALGVMFVKGDNIVPVVYVKDTDSTVFEGSCGSGAAAVASYLKSVSGKDSFAFTFPRGEIGVTVYDEKIKINSFIEVVNTLNLPLKARE